MSVLFSIAFFLAKEFLEFIYLNEIRTQTVK